MRTTQSRGQYLESSRPTSPLLTSDQPSTLFTQQQMISISMGREVSIDEIQRSIPHCRFHYILILIHLLLYVSTSFIVYNFAYFQMSPRYKCTFTDPSSPEFLYTSECTKEQICSADSPNQVCMGDKSINQVNSIEITEQNKNHKLIKWDIQWDSTHSLKNWITWLNLHCADNYKIGMFGSLYFAGFLISCLIFPPLSDKYGRKDLFLMGGLSQLIVISIMLLDKSIEIQLIMIFSLGFAQPVKSMIAYTHLMEFLPGRESKISGVFMFLDGLVIVITPFLIHLISQDLNMLLFIALLFNVVSLVLFLITRIPESTKYLIQNQKYIAFEKAIQRVKSLGGLSDQQIAKTFALLKIYELQQRTKVVIDQQLNNTWNKNSIERLKGAKNIAYNLVLMTISWTCVSFSYFMISFFIKYLPGDIYENQSVSGLSAFAFLFAGPISRKLDNKITLTLSFLIATLASLTMVVFMQLGISPEDGLSIFILLIRCGVNLAFCLVFVIHTQLFPPNFLATSYGICNFFCRSVTLFAPIIAEVEDKSIPMYTLLAACFIGTLSSFSLRQMTEKEETLITSDYPSISNTPRDRHMSISLIK
ncbi:organic cation [Stylonychia lemnae]|uniref:Organic cation n=1 Tax=Stylonychia lemnae TaxID=5949 RepID=A0A077ZSQ4_STYLE|nr:organic cation [Stylonychia lemnae]|eukprot:CDW72340.1 organic cation [Stylonychia lemnae]